MTKFILPATIVKAPTNTILPAHMWPIGTLYQHVATGIYFRFVKLGGRWDTEYGISSDRGLYTMSGLVNSQKEGKIIARPDKNIICDMFVKTITG